MTNKSKPFQVGRSNLFPSLKNTFQRRTFTNIPSFQSAPPLSNTTVLLGGAAVMIGTFTGLNYLLNRKDPLFSVSTSNLTSSSVVREYLAGTYAYVTAGLGITGITAFYAYKMGVAARLMGNPMLSFGLSLVAIIGTSIATQATPAENVLQKHLFWVLNMSSVGVLSLSSLGYLPAGLLFKAGVYTFGIVSSLSMVAMYSKNDAFLYLGGPLMMGLSVVVLSSLVSAFAPMGGRVFQITNNISLYGGLGVFSLFMLYDTQRIMMRANLSRGRNPDYINESMHLYYNIINIFIRIVQILGNNNKK